MKYVNTILWRHNLCKLIHIWSSLNNSKQQGTCWPNCLQSAECVFADQLEHQRPVSRSQQTAYWEPMVHCRQCRWVTSRDREHIVTVTLHSKASVITKRSREACVAVGIAASTLTANSSASLAVVVPTAVFLSPFTTCNKSPLRLT